MSQILQDLRLKPVGIGSLPHSNPDDAMQIVRKDFYEIPFYPQLANVSRNEDMICQFLEGLPSFNPEDYSDFVADMESEDFIEGLEEFFTDYEEIMADINSPRLEKYAISENFSSTFSKYEDFIREIKPDYAKGQITGAFTITTSINNQEGKTVIYDETLREVFVKLLSLKALWEIKHIKQATPETTPIIFMDEPSVSQIGTSAYLTITDSDVISMIKEISDVIKSNGALSAIHCCGKCDWRIAIKTGVDIINFDAYSYFDNFCAYHKEINSFLKNGGKLAWGMVPTFDEELLNNLTADDLVQKFYNSVKNLTNNGIDEKLISDNSLITSSCGAGALSLKGAQKAMDLIKELSDKLRNEE